MRVQHTEEIYDRCGNLRVEHRLQLCGIPVLKCEVKGEFVITVELCSVLSFSWQYLHTNRLYVRNEGGVVSHTCDVRITRKNGFFKM